MRFLFFVVILGSCSPSAESIDEDWNVFVEENNSCQNADECVAVFPGCPLACATAVSKSAQELAKTEAADLISSYECGGEACAFDCDKPGTLVCESSRCGFQNE